MLVPHIAGFSPVTSCMIPDTAYASRRLIPSVTESRKALTLESFRWVFNWFAIPVPRLFGPPAVLAMMKSAA